nr:hypothetical protein [uncultured Desulfobulbus sp.]
MRNIVTTLLLKPGGDAVIAGKIKINNRIGPGRQTLAPTPRPTLNQLSGKISRLGEQEKADLSDMGAGGNVYQILIVPCKRVPY